MENKEEEVVCIGDYFKENETFGVIEEWIFSAAPSEEKQKFPKFRVPRFHRTLSTWINALLTNGFSLIRMNEPVASEDGAENCPGIMDTRIAPYFLHILCKKISRDK